MWLSLIQVLAMILGGLFAVAACFVSWGLIGALGRPGALPTGWEVLLVLAVPVVMFAIAAGFLLLARRLDRIERKRQEAAARAAELALACPHCQADRLVRGPQGSVWKTQFRYQARCLTCGERYWVDGKIWKRLPQPQLGEPHETPADRFDIMKRQHMTTGHMLCALAGVICGFALIPYVAVRLSGSLGHLTTIVTCLALGIPMFGAWRLGYWLFPPPRLPGQRCVKCGFDLRGCTEPRCPECGTAFDWKDLRTRLGQTGDSGSARESDPPK